MYNIKLDISVKSPVFSSSKRLNAHTKRLVNVLLHFPYGFFLGLSYLFVTTDIFFSLLKRKTATEGPIEVLGVPSVWGVGWDSEEKLFGEAH